MLNRNGILVIPTFSAINVKKDGIRMNKMQSIKSMIVLIGATITSDWLIGLLPFDALPLPGYLIGILYHLTSAGVWVLLIRELYPTVLKRFSKNIELNRFKVATFVVGYFGFISLFHSGIFSAPISDLLIGLAFTLSIGIDEDIFSRGLIFGAFEHLGIPAAAFISSLHFGLLHFGNFMWGGQSLDYTFGQMVNAMAFGYLCCGLMVYSGSIYPAIVLHGLSDIPMFMQKQSDFMSQVTGTTDWIPTLIQAVIYFAAGWILISLNRPSIKNRFIGLASKLGLVE